MNIAPTRTLVLVNILAIAGLAYLWVDQHGKLRNMTWTAPAPIKPLIANPKLLEKSAASDPALFSSTLERPLFAPDRRPPPPVLPPPPPPPPDPLADVQLLGIISGETGSILIRSEGKTRRINLNQTLGEWTLQAIEERSVTFARASETRVIKLTYKSLNAAVKPVNNIDPRSATGTPSVKSDAIRRQDEETEDRQRRVDAMRAQMNQKKP